MVHESYTHGASLRDSSCTVPVCKGNSHYSKKKERYMCKLFPGTSGGTEYFSYFCTTAPPGAGILTKSQTNL